MASTVARIPSSARACAPRRAGRGSPRRRRPAPARRGWPAGCARRRSSAPNARRPRPTRAGTRAARPPRAGRRSPGVSVSATSSRHTGTMRCCGTSSQKDVAPGAVWQATRGAHRWRRRAPGGAGCWVVGSEGPVEARPGPGVARPVPVLVHHARAARRRRSRSARPAPIGGPPRSPPCTSTRPGCGSRTRTCRSTASGAGPRRPCTRA